MSKLSAGWLFSVLGAYGLLTASIVGPATPAAMAACSSGGDPTVPPLVADFLRGYRASFSSPTGIAVDALGNVYIADPAKGSVLVRGADGRVLTVGEELGNPASVAVVADGNRIYVGDGIDGRVTAYGPDWLPLFDLGQGNGELAFPSDIALDPATENVWVTDSFEHRIEVYDPAGVWLFGFGGRGSANGQFQSPKGIHVDATADEVLVVDQLNGRVQVFDRNGNFKSCLGVKGSGDGRLNMPQGIWSDDLGRIYVSDAFEGWVHVFDRQGATVAFLGAVRDLGVGPGRLTTPTDLAIDPSGRLFVSSSTTAGVEMFGLDNYADPELFVPAEVALDPDLLDPLSPGATIAAVIEVPGYRIDLVEPDSVSANGVAAQAGSAIIGDADADHVPDLSVTFDGSAVAVTLPPEGGTVRVSGQIGSLELEGFDHLDLVAAPGNDGDGDGVPDGEDLCPDTAPGEPIDDGGCSLDQLCPCSGPTPGQPWRNHGQYVSCVAQAVRDISRPPLDQQTRSRLVSEAAASSCGR